MSKWMDSRVHKPLCNHADKYIVVASDYEGSRFVGLALWMPTNNYTNGEWQDVCNTNGNSRSYAKVLYWYPHPELPKDVL